MKLRLLVGLAIVLGGACLLAPSTASAQATRTWVSGVGDDANPCSRTAPCKTFAGAISKTAAAGEINCIDSGGYGALTITKSIAIKCDSYEAGVLVSGTNGFVVAAASTDVVWISGLDFEGLGPTALSLNGIKINTAAVVTVVNCTIRGFGSTNGTDGNGIFMTTNSNAKLQVFDTLIGDNANTGIDVKPSAGTATVEISRTRASNQGVGFRANGTGGSTAITMNITDSVAVGNSSGISIAGGASNTNVMVNRTDVANNAAFGLNAPTGTIRVGNSSITGNGTATNGTVSSYGNNQINGNTTDTTPGVIPTH
jgi:hypothetical protein